MRRHFWRAFFKPYAIETNASSMKPISTLHIIIVTRNGKILPKSLPSRPKHRGLLFLKKTWFSLKGMSYLQVIFVLIWMKKTLIWFNLQRDGTGNGFSNIKNTFAETLQLQMSVLHKVCASSRLAVLIPQVKWWLGKI